MSILSKFRSLAKKLGCDVRRFPTPEFLEFHLKNKAIAGVLDVGANEGQYGMSLRNSGYSGQIVSVEPVNAAFNKIRARAQADRRWTCHNFALGECAGSAEINVGKGTVFSSLLRSNSFAHALAHDSESHERQTIKVQRMDDVFHTFQLPDGPLMLKIDTQGFEMPVMRGGEHSLKRFSIVQLEMSLRPMYEGQPPFHEVIAFLRDHGFVLASLLRGFSDWRTHEIIEVDGIFVRLNGKA